MPSSRINPKTGKRFDWVDPRKAEIDERDLKKQISLLERQKMAQEARDDLLKFTRFTMPDPENIEDANASKYEEARFHIEVAKALQSVERGEIPQLIFCMPARHGKTEIATKRMAAWYSGRHPDHDVIVAQASDKLAEDAGADVRTIMSLPQYKLVFPEHSLLRGGMAKSNLQTRKGGRLIFAGKSGTINGRGAHLLLIDDLYSGMDEARSDTVRNAVWEWFTRVAMKRRMGKKLVIITMTRWHSDDVIGRLTDPENPHYNAQEAAMWKIIRLPGLAEDDDPLGRKPGEALWPERYDREYHLADQRRDPLGFSALVQQRPSVADGVLFRRETIQYYTPEQLPEDLRYYCASDHAVGLNQRNDPTCLLKVGIDRQDNIYIIDTIWRRMATDQAVEAMLAMAGGNKRPLLWWAERGHISKSIGPFLRKRMLEEQTYINLVEVTPAADKETRAQSIAARVAMGKVYFPKVSWWTEKAVDELMAFPNGNHDDFCLSADTQIRMADGREKAISEVRAGDSVATPNGVQVVDAAGMTAAEAAVLRVNFSDGRHLDATPNHPVFVAGKGFVRTDTLTYGDVLFDEGRYATWRTAKSLDTAVADIGAIRTARAGITAAISTLRGHVVDFFTVMCGRTTTARSPKDSRYTTKTKIHSTMSQGIWSACRSLGIGRFTFLSGQNLSTTIGNLPRYGLSQRHGTGANPALRGTEKTENELGRGGNAQPLLARVAASWGKRFSRSAPSSAARTAVFVSSVEALTTPQPVYNLTVRNEHVFFANGVLTHNCDTLAYIGLGLQSQFGPAKEAPKPKLQEGTFAWLNKQTAWQKAKERAAAEGF